MQTCIFNSLVDVYILKNVIINEYWQLPYCTLHFRKYNQQNRLITMTSRVWAVGGGNGSLILCLG